MEFCVAKPIMYFLALTVCPIYVFFFFCQTNSFVLIFHLPHTYVAMEVLWSSQQQQRRRNDSGRASVCCFFTSHRFPRGPCPVADKEFRNEWGTDQEPSDTESMCSSQEGHKRHHQIKVYIWASFCHPFSFLKCKRRFVLIQDYFTLKIIYTVVRSTSTQSHFVIPH